MTPGLGVAAGLQAPSASMTTTGRCPLMAPWATSATAATIGQSVLMPQGESPREIDERLAFGILLVCSMCQRLRWARLVTVGHSWCGGFK